MKRHYSAKQLHGDQKPVNRTLLALMASPTDPLRESVRLRIINDIEVALKNIQIQNATAEEWRLVVNCINMVHEFNEASGEFVLSESVEKEHAAALAALVAMSERVPIHFTEAELKDVKVIIDIFSDILECAPQREVLRVEKIVVDTWNRCNGHNPYGMNKANQKKKIKSRK